MRNFARVSSLSPFGLSLMLLQVSACSKGDDAAKAADSAALAASVAAPPASLYDRLGGKTAITAVVDSFVARVAADTRINGKFARSNIPRVKTMLVDQICAQSGGPCTYTGRSMKEAHANMGVTDGEFGALVEDLIATMAAFNIPQMEQDDLLTALGAMRTDIVAVKSPETGTRLPASFKAAPPLDSTKK